MHFAFEPKELLSPDSSGGSSAAKEVSPMPQPPSLSLESVEEISYLINCAQAARGAWIPLRSPPREIEDLFYSSGGRIHVAQGIPLPTSNNSFNEISGALTRGFSMSWGLVSRVPLEGKVIDDGTVVLRFAQDRETPEANSIYLMLSNIAPKVELCTREQFNVRRSFREADCSSTGIVTYENEPLPCATLVDKTGRALQRTMPSPNGLILGERINVNFPKGSFGHKIVRCEKRGNEHYIRFEMLVPQAKDGQSCEARVGFHEVALSSVTTGLQSRKANLNSAQSALRNIFHETSIHPNRRISYRDAPRPVPELFGEAGVAFSVRTPTPNGSIIGKIVRSGFPAGTRNHELLECRESNDGSWIWISGVCPSKNGSNQKIERCFRFAKDGDQNNPIPEIVNPSQWAVITAYRDGFARFDEEVSYEHEPRPCGEVFGERGFRARESWPLPCGKPLGQNQSLGFPLDTRDHELLSTIATEAGIRIKIRGWQIVPLVDDEPIRVSVERHLLFDHQASGAQALLAIYDSSQVNILRAYQDARRSVTGFVSYQDDILDIGECVEPSGTKVRKRFVDSNGKIVGPYWLGLPEGSFGHGIVSCEDTSEGFLLRIRALARIQVGGGEVVTSHFTYLLVRENPGAQEEALQNLDESEYELLKTYVRAREQGSVSFSYEDGPRFSLVGSNNRLLYRFLLLNGQSQRNPNILLAPAKGPPFVDGRIIRASYFPAVVNSHSSEQVILMVHGKIGSQDAILRLQVTTEDVTVLGNVNHDEALFVNLLKGKLMDELTAHVIGDSSLTAWSSKQTYTPYLLPSPLERFCPNLSRPYAAIIHTKWGRNGHEMRDYMLRYTRLALAWRDQQPENAESISLTFLVAVSDHLQALQDIGRAIEEQFTDAKEKGAFKRISITVETLEQFSERCPTRHVDPQTLSVHDARWIRRELTRISDAAFCGNIAWLSKQSYLRSTQVSGSRHGETPATESLNANYEVATLSVELTKHFRNFWSGFGDEYHITICIFCSEVLERLGPTPKSPAELQLVEYIREHYPELCGNEEERILLRAFLDEQKNSFPEGVHSLEAEVSRPQIKYFSLSTILAGSIQPQNPEKTKTTSSADAFTDFQTTAPVSSGYSRANSWLRERNNSSCTWSTMLDPPALGIISPDERFRLSLTSRSLLSQLFQRLMPLCFEKIRMDEAPSTIPSFGEMSAGLLKVKVPFEHPAFQVVLNMQKWLS